MQTVLDYCAGGSQELFAPGDVLLREGDRTGHLYVLIEGQVEVVKGDTVVATTTEPGAMFGEMAVLLDRDHSASVRASASSTFYVIDDAAAFLRDRPDLVLLIARLLAQRLSAATSYLADIKQQYAGHGNHLSMVSDVLQSMINLLPAQILPGSDLKSDSRI